MTPLHFAQLICSRLCHDLITPIGAIVSGFEIMEDCSEEDRLQLAELTRQSARTASRRLAFYRAAFGFSAHAHFSSLEDIKKVIRDFLDETKYQLTWESEEGKRSEAQPREDLTHLGRLTVNLALIAVDVMPQGGHLLISLERETRGRTLSITARGGLVPLKKEIKCALLGQIPEQNYSPHNIQAVMTKQIADTLQALIEIEDENKISLTLKARQTHAHFSPSLFDR